MLPWARGLRGGTARGGNDAVFSTLRPRRGPLGDQQVPRASCLYEGLAAGYVETDGLRGEAARYDFVPLRSMAHLRLAETIKRQGSALVDIAWDGGPVRRRATRLTPDSITLAPAT